MTQTIGSRRQVWNGTAKRTSGGLTKGDLMMSHGRIVSRSKHFSAKKEMRLLKYGYGTKKGKFGYVKIGTKKHRKGHRKMKGGMPSLSPGSANWNGDGISGAGVTDFGGGSTGLQMEAGMSGGRRRSRRMAGGSGMAAMAEPGSANWNGDGISGAGVTDFGGGSTGLQMEAGMSGGRRRKRRMMGGTGSQVNRSVAGGYWGPNAMALNAA